MDSRLKYIYKLPYKQCHILCRILDADGKWEELGGSYMKYDDVTLKLIGKAVFCGKSPTSELLKIYSEKNGTIEQLFIWLYRMDHRRAMSVLEPYVDQKYLSLKKTYTTSCLSNSSKQNILKSSASQFSVTSTNSLSNMAEESSTCANNDSEDDILPDLLKVPFSEVIKATDNFNLARLLGAGGFGSVYKGKWKGTDVAIKRLKSKSDSVSRKLVSFKQSLNELNILKCCRHDHILPLYAVSLDGAHPCLIYELMVNGTLEDRLRCKNNSPPLTWSQRSDIAECIAKGLNYLHTTYKKPLVHGDIKSANILLDANMKAKIGDFGLTRKGPNYNLTHITVKAVNGTPYYLPDEYLRGRKLSTEVDSYSYGIVMLEIATGLMPYRLKPGKNLVEYVKKYEDNGQLNSLYDCKAGMENIFWFRVLIKIGQVCSSSEKKKRPQMQKVLAVFDKVKTEITRMREIPNIKGDEESQINNADLNTKKPTNVACAVIPLVTKPSPKDSSRTESEFNIESLEKTDSSISSESSISIESKSSILRQNLTNNDASSSNKIMEAENGIPPVPLISNFLMQMPKNSDCTSLERSLCDAILSQNLINNDASSPDESVEQIRIPPVPAVSILQMQLSSTGRDPDGLISEKSIGNAILGQNLISSDTSSLDKSVEAEIKIPPVPVISVLQMQVS